MNIRKKLIAFIPALFFVVLVFGMPSIASAADRYWVGDNGTWNIMANWSATSGGAGGETVPTSADNVFFDDAGFSGVTRTVTINAEANCADMTWLTTTGTKTLSLNNAGNQLHIYGSLTLASGMAVTGNTDEILFDAPLGTHSITSNGISIDLDISFNGAGGTWVLQDNLSTIKSIALTAGTFDANDFDVTTPTFTASGTNTRALDMGSGTWTLNGTSGNAWDITDPTSLTFDAETSIIDISNTGATEKRFHGGGLTYNTVTFSGRNILIADSSTFDTMNVDNAGLTDALFVQNGTTQVVTNFTTNGSAGNLANIAAYTGGGGCTPFTLSKSSGTVSVDYMNISCSTATGGATWYAGANSADAGGNTGWVFSAAPTDRYWVGGTGSWSDDTNHWATSSGGAPGSGNLPTAANDVFFDTSSSTANAAYTVTVDPIGDFRPAKNFTMDGPGAGNKVTWAGSAQLHISGSLNLSGGTAGIINSYTGQITFDATSGTNTITSNGITYASTFTFDGVGGTWQLSDALDTSQNMNLNHGSLDANGANVSTIQFFSSNCATRGLTLGSGTWTLTGAGLRWYTACSSGLTLISTGSTILINDTASGVKQFYGGGLSYGTLTASGRNVAIKDSNTFNTLNVANAGLMDGLFVESGTTQTVTNFTTNGSSGNLAIISASGPGTPFTLSKASGTVSVDYMDITDSTATGGANWFAGANSTDGGGNTGWIFTAPTDRYWVGDSGTWDASDTTHWAEVSGGPGGFSVPTNTNNCYFDANSFSGGGEIVTITAEAHCHDMTWTTADAPSLVSSADLYIAGSLTLASGMTVSFSSGAIYFYAVDAQTVTSNAVTIDAHFYFATAGTWTLQDNLSVGEYFALVEGTFDANGFDVLSEAFYSSYTNTRSIQMGSGTWTLSGVSTVWDITDPTGLTFDAETSTIDITDTSGAAKDFFGGGLTYNSITSSGNHIIINGSNTFNTINVDNAGLSDGLYFNSNLQNTITNFTTNGSSGNLAIIQSDAGGPFILSKSGGTVSVDYMSIYNSTATGTATWYAGANSVDAGGNTGWIFTPPSAASTPTAAPIAGTYTGTQSVVLTSAGSTTIRYTTDGSTPTCLVGTLYGGAISVSLSLTIKAVGCDGASIASPVASFAYTINMSSGGGGGGYYIAQQPTATPIPTFTPVPPFPQLPTRGDPANLARYGLHEGDVMGARPSGDPDVFIVNQWGYKRLFLNPVIFGFYGHLGGFSAVTSVVPFGRDAFPTSGLFRNCETQDRKVYALEVTGEDTGTLHWVNMTGEQAIAQDPDFFKKDFCINSSEFNWYTLSPTPYTSLSQMPMYRR